MDSEQEGRREKKSKKRLRVTMEYVAPSSELAPPVVGYFPSGYDMFRKEDGPQVQLYQHKSRPNRMELVVRPQASNVEFVGTSYSGEAAQPQICKYSIGILDKETRTLKIVPIAANKIFRLDPKIKVVTDEEAPVEVLTEDKWKERNLELSLLYGSKKNKKMVNKFVKMREQADDPDAQEYMKKELQDVEVNTKALADASEVVHNIPPHDLTADAPEKAYLLDRIIPKSEWSHLVDILEAIESQDKASPGIKWDELGYPVFVSERIEKLKAIKDEKKKRKFARILSYITHLVNFLNMSSDKHRFRSKIREGTTADYIPQVVFQRFISLFVDPASEAISKEKRELLIGYILVLTLFADNFRTRTTDIAKDLKMTHSSLRPFFVQLGCIFKIEDGKSYCMLQVPLKLEVPLPRKFKRPR